MRNIKGELGRFFVSGCVAVITDAVIYYALLPFLAPWLSKSISFIAGATFAYFINKFWTFKKTGFSHKEVIKFIFVYGTTLFVNVGINSSILFLFNSYFFAYIIATGISASLNFVGQKIFVFKIMNGEYMPKHDENRMKNEGDVNGARKNFLNNPSNNLKFLVEQRYKWMNDYIDENSRGIEVGCGTGVSKFYIKSKNFILTDYCDNEWLDVKNVDSLHTPFENNSFDFVIAGNMIHHLPYPVKFFEEMNRILKPGGVLLIQEINASFFMRLFLRLMRHEGYSFKVDVFNENLACTDPKDLWSANCAIPNLLFDDKDKFKREISYFEIISNRYSEFFIFLNSGGVIAKIFYIPLPWFLLKIAKAFDDILTKGFSNIFALQRKVVLKKI